MKKAITTMFACSIFSAAFGCFILFITDGINVLVANHEDWYAADAEVTFVPANGKRFGMVYFDFASEKTAQGGMNTAGLFFDGTRTPNAPYPENENKKDCHCYIWTKILQECSTVDEAVKYVQQYKVPEMEDIHVMFADRFGNSAVLGVYEGKLQVHRRTGNCQLLTNFNLSNPSYGDEPVCKRFTAADSMLHIDSSATVENLQQILSNTHQEKLTVYSNVYNLTRGEVYVYTKNNFSKRVMIGLADELKKGKHAVMIDKLFKGK